MRLSGVTSRSRLLRRSAMRMGYGRGLPHEATGAFRLPVTGGGAGSATPLETAPAPLGSSTPPLPFTSSAGGEPQANPAATTNNAGSAARTLASNSEVVFMVQA